MLWWKQSESSPLLRPAQCIALSLLCFKFINVKRAIMSYYYNKEPHFLEACYLCRKPLGDNSDIFMYRGNTPFCSKECRQEQIQMDDYSTKKRTWKLSSSSSSSSSSVRSMRESDPKENSSSKTVRTGTVAVA